MNQNLNNVESPPIDYFNHLLDNVKTNIQKISFGHGIPRFTPNEYANINPQLFDHSNSFKYTDIRGEKVFPKLAIIRPSLLVGNRKSFRLGEVIFKPILKAFTFFTYGNLNLDLLH